MAVLATGSRWTLSAMLDHFIPKPMLADAEQHRRARMFMLSHVFGPILGNSLPGYLFAMDLVRDYRVFIFFVSITAFWIYPFLLKSTGRYKLLAFISVQNLSFCVVWACYAFGGLLSPFLPWMLIIPLLSFLYLPSVGWVRNILLAQLVMNVGTLLFLCLGPVRLPEVNLQELQVIGLISMGAVAIYFAMMALYFAKMFHEQREFGRELNRLVSSSDNLRNLTTVAEQAGAAKADFIASMSHELRTPLNAIIGYSQLLLEEAADENDEESVGDLQNIHRSGSHLLYLIDHILDYSRIEAGRMPVNPRPDTFAASLPRWRADIAKKAASVELQVADGLEMDRVLLTDWTALGAIVRNVILGIVEGAGKCHVTIDAKFEDDGQFRMGFIHHDNSGQTLPITLHEEIFENARDVSPTKYGAMGIEPALALKYVYLLGGQLVEEEDPLNPHVLWIGFPSLEPQENQFEAAQAA